MFSDEASFWTVAAQNFIKNDFIVTHQQIYRGGGLHPFGVPFIDALPSLVLGFSPGAIYALPLLNIFLISVFLFKIRSRPWVCFFFLCAIFSVFKYNSWLGSLMYQLTYGEGFCSVFYYG
jgi:glucan phosphoethanolaminetransferase (alkaline phosphatase superfamily)